MGTRTEKLKERRNPHDFSLNQRFLVITSFLNDYSMVEGRIFPHEISCLTNGQIIVLMMITTFIDALEILKALLCGQKVGTELSDCISYGQEQAELQFEFSTINEQI